MESINEIELVEAAKVNPHAFGQLYDLHYPAIYGFLIKRTGNSDIAKDLTSETFFQALKKINRFEHRGRPFKSWLFAIAVAQVGTYYRSRRKLFKLTNEEGPEVMADSLYQPDASYIESQDIAEVESRIKLMRLHFRKLNDTHQTILTLRYLTPHSIAEISQILGMKENTVKSHIHRALKKLQILMKNDDNESYVSNQSTSRNRTTAIQTATSRSTS